MKLFETVYMKITNKDRIYYLLYKSYADEHDGKIEYKEINEKRFEKAKELGLKTEEESLENARFGTKRRIERGYFKGVERKVE